MQQKHDNAIVTLAVGDDYVANFMRYAHPTWKPYCEKHGYDLILLTEPIDPAWDPATSRKSVHWQKLLIGTLPQLRDYRGLAWMDGDILINHRLAPCLFSEVRNGGIGVVDGSDWFYQADDTFNIHSRYLILNLFMKMTIGGRMPGDLSRVTVTDGDLASYYRFVGLDGDASRMINTGLLVFDPGRHGNFLAEVYTKYDRDFMDFENTPLSFELQTSGRAEYIDNRFNVVWSAAVARHYPFLFNPEILPNHGEVLRLCANATFRNAFFLHFASGAGNPIVKGLYDTVDADAGSIIELLFPDLWERRDDCLDLCRLDGIDRTGRGILF